MEPASRKFGVSFRDQQYFSRLFTKDDTLKSVKEAIQLKFDIKNEITLYRKTDLGELEILDDDDWNFCYSNLNVEEITAKPNDDQFPNDEKLIYLHEIIIKKTLGAGSSGQVKSGEYKGNPVAIKIVGPVGFNVEREDIERELRILKKLPKHENIIEFYGFIHFDLGRYSSKYFVTELGNISLSDICRENYLTFPQKFECAIQISKGIEVLHQNNIIHLDLAPRNCLMMYPFDGYHKIHVKIIDFGSARILKNGTEFKSLKTKTEIFSHESTPPEALGDRIVSKYFDIWSFGVSLWKLFRNGDKNPYGDCPDLEYSLKNGKRLARPLDCPLNVYEIILHCWYTDPIKSLKDLQEKLGDLMKWALKIQSNVSKKFYFEFVSKDIGFIFKLTHFSILHGSIMISNVHPWQSILDSILESTQLPVKVKWESKEITNDDDWIDVFSKASAMECNKLTIEILAKTFGLNKDTSE